MKKILVAALVALVLVVGVGSAAGGSVTYKLELVSIDAQPDLQHYGLAHFKITFADGKWHQCCDWVQVVTDCDNGYTGGGGPSVHLWYTSPTPALGAFYSWDLSVPITCSSHVERLNDHNKRQGIASNVVTYTSP